MTSGGAESGTPKPMRMRHLLRAIRQGKKHPEKKVHRIRIPVRCASLVFSLADNLKHKKPSETLEWLFNNSEEAVKRAIGGIHDNPITKSSDNSTVLIGPLNEEGRVKKIMSKDGRRLAENGRTPRIRLPEDFAQKLYSLTNKLGLKTNGQTVKWLCDHCQPAIAAILYNKNSTTVCQSASENKDGQLSEMVSSDEASSIVNPIQYALQPTSSNNQLGYRECGVQSPSSRVSSTAVSNPTDLEINDFDVFGFMDIVNGLNLTADDITQQGYPDPLATNSIHCTCPCYSTGYSQYTVQHLPNYSPEPISFHFPSNCIDWCDSTQHQIHPQYISGHHSTPCINNDRSSQCVQQMQTIVNGFGDHHFALPNYNEFPQFTQQQSQFTINGYSQSTEQVYLITLTDQKPRVSHVEALQGGNQFVQSIGGLKKAEQRIKSEKTTVLEDCKNEIFKW